MPEEWSQQWWLEFRRRLSGPWKVGFSDPACRRLSILNGLPQSPDWHPLQELLVRLQREGVPANAARISSAVGIYRLAAGDFQLQGHIYPTQRLISVERLRHPLIQPRT